MSSSEKPRMAVWSFSLFGITNGITDFFYRQEQDFFQITVIYLKKRIYCKFYTLNKVFQTLYFNFTISIMADCSLPILIIVISI